MAGASCKGQTRPARGAVLPDHVSGRRWLSSGWSRNVDQAARNMRKLERILQCIINAGQVLGLACTFAMSFTSTST